MIMKSAIFVWHPGQETTLNSTCDYTCVSIDRGELETFNNLHIFVGFTLKKLIDQIDFEDIRRTS